MSPEAQAVCFFVAMALFVASSIIAWVTTPRPNWPVPLGAGLAVFTLVFFWTAVKAS